MKIPSKIKIGGHWFDVEIKTEKDGYDKQGTVCRWWNKIFIQADLAQSKKESNLLHEIIHEIDHQAGTELTEQQICVLSQGLYQVLIDWESFSEG